MNITYQAINDMKAVDMDVDSTIVVEDSLEIMTIDHEDQSNVLHAIKKDTGMQTVHIKIEPT